MANTFDCNLDELIFCYCYYAIHTEHSKHVTSNQHQKQIGSTIFKLMQYFTKVMVYVPYFFLNKLHALHVNIKVQVFLN